MYHFVELERLPHGLEFPEEYRDRISYDPGTKRLCYRGFMSKADFDRLCLLGDDWSYRRNLEDLFRLCTAEASPGPRGLRGWLSPFIGRPSSAHP